MSQFIPIFTSIEDTLIGLLSGVYSVVLLVVPPIVSGVFTALPIAFESLDSWLCRGIPTKNAVLVKNQLIIEFNV